MNTLKIEIQNDANGDYYYRNKASTLFVVVVFVVLFLFLSGHRMRVGYETSDEEKIKNKFKPASVKEPTSHFVELQRK